MTAYNAFRPRRTALALEPRILFDGAAGVAIDQNDAANQTSDAPDVAPNAAPAVAPEAPPRTLVVIDTRIDNYQTLAAQSATSADIVLVGTGEDGLKAIADALAAGGKVGSIQILSHGAAGQFTLGNSTVSADNVAALGDTLRAWAPQLTDNADILLYGCGVGAGEPGRTLITALAAATGADVAASTNNTGATSAGGDWTLEVATGAIETSLAAISYDGLLAAGPSVTLSATTMDSLLGGQFSFTATFTNTSGDVGYAPFIDLILPATGKDGAGAEVDDGITFVSATYLGQPVTAYVVTFDASGNASHPLAKDNTGAPVIINAATYGARAGDQLVVLQVPYASVTSTQPSIPIVITAQLSDLADTTDSPALTLKARGGFQFGNDPADNPLSDPSLFESSFEDLVVTPSGLTLTQTINMPEGETATGPNFERSLTVTATPPPGQTMTNVDISQNLPNAIRVTAITPGAGGTIASLTLRNGSTITDPLLITLALAESPYLSSYTVRYASLAAPTDTVVSFYVPEQDATGADVINPVTGDDVSIILGQPTATGEWLPLDPRDQTVVDPGPPQVVEPNVITAIGNNATFVAKSVALLKTVRIASNTGSAGLSPGDELQYTLNVDLSDYFAIGRTLLGAGHLTITDQLGDGQTLTGSPVLTIFFEGVQYNLALVTVVGAPGPSGTTLSFDIAQSIANSNAIFGGALIGDIAFDGDLEGATRAVITYRSIVAQAYTTVYTPTTPFPRSEINEGDSIGNNATVSGTLLANNISVTGDTETDTSAASLTVPTNTVATSIVTVNGAAPPANVELKPGDIVTFKLAYDLQTGDYEQFKLTAYMPLPLFDLGAAGTFTGTWTYGSGDTNADNVDTVTVGAGNSLVFDFGNYATSDLSGKRIEVQFTLTVGNQPFGDQRSLTVLGESNQLTTIAQTRLISNGVVTIASVAEPVLAITHGVVAVGAGSAGVVTGTTGTWAAAGSTGQPFTGSITDLTAVDGNVDNIDGGDLVRLATAIENTGGLGAFDVTTTVTLPVGFTFAGSSLAASNLAIYRGNGTLLVLNTDYSVSGNTITFLDAGGQPTLLPGRAGTATDISGANLIVITYDVVAAADIAASKTLQTSAALTNYSSANNGPDFSPGIDPFDIANQTVAAPTVTLVFANGTLTNDDSSATHTSGANLVIGESMLYDIVVTLPEGSTQSLRLTDLIPAGLTLDTSFGGSYELITTTAGSSALSANFAGIIGSINSSTAGSDGADLGLTFSAASATSDNNAGNNSFVIRVRLIASNVSGNQAGFTRSNSAQLVYSDPDGDTPNGITAQDRTVALSSSQPTVSIVEPTLTITQTQTNNGGSLGVDRNDEITYTITIRNNSGINAFDISFLDTVPSQLIFSEPGFGLQSLTYAGGATNNGGPDFVVLGSAIVSDPAANIDIPTGGSITLVIKGRVRSDLGSINDIVNTATAQWTSLDGSTTVPTTGERSGVDGLLNSGVLNDYRFSNSLSVPVAAGATISHVGLLPDTLVTYTSDPQMVAVGELIYYRVAFLIPEGDTNDASVVIYLPTGLTFAGDTRVALVDGGAPLVSSDVVLTLSLGGPRIDQDITDLEQSLLDPDLYNAATAKLRTELIDATNPNAIKISLGNVTNQNNDQFLQMIYLDFFVRVGNLASVDTADNFNVTADFFSGTLKQTSTPAAVEQIVEPNLRDLQKTVTDFNPNAAGTTGTATVTLAFSNRGDGIAYDARLTDSVTGGNNYALSAVVINGTSYAPGSLPAGVTVSTAGGITADFSTVAIGSSIKLIYTVDVPNSAAIASTNATLSWSSLPESFTDGSAVAGGAIVQVGADGTASGERDGSGGSTAPNTYVVREGAGLGIITGTLWDDTQNPNDGLTLGGTRLANQTVTLTWAGADGDLATTGDNRIYTAVTDINGNYRFGVLPTGNFRIDATNPVINHPFGGDTDNAKVRIDSDGGTLGSVTISALGESAAATALFGYVRDNDAPVNTLPANQVMLEDGVLDIDGIFISDIDAGAGDLTVTLTVKHGILFLVPSGVTIVGGAVNTATVTIQGTTLNINTTLDSLLYTPIVNYNGSDTLTITTNDRGNSGNADGNLLPNELADALTDTDKLTITITPVNDVPVANSDTVKALEAGGWYNDVDGYPGVVNVLKNDTDADLADKPSTEKLTVTRIGLGSTTTDDVPLIGNRTVAGLYGTLTIKSNGDTTYTINNDNDLVQALRLSGQTLTETFTYEMSDLVGTPKPSATLTVTIRGANDTPVGTDDVGNVYEAGGVNNGTSGGTSVLPNVLANDTDKDSVANGETKNVTGIRAKPESATTGAFSGVASGTNSTTGTTVTGTYGTLKIGSDGSFDYIVNQSATAVQRLVAGDTLDDYFSYIVTDALGDTDVAQIKITIHGAEDNPVANNDVALARAARLDGGGAVVGTPVNPIGNVLLSFIGTDTDVDRLNSLTATGVRTGTEGAGGTLVSITAGTSFASGYTEITSANGYGTLRIGADGSFRYFVDSTNATIKALAPNASVQDFFTYEASDSAGLIDLAQLTVTIFGVNNTPLAQDDFSVAIEAGGIGNATPGLDPTDDALTNDTDPENLVLTVIGVRTGTETPGAVTGGVGSPLAGLYGSLTLNANGVYTYTVNNSLAAVQNLRQSTDTLTDIFTYTAQDTGGLNDNAQIVIEIRGQNDNPVATDNVATAVEAGGVANGTSGTNPSGNVLTDDTDEDGVAYGETKTVSAVRTGAEAATGTAGTVGVALTGTNGYGYLTLNADGSYQYVVNNNNAAVQALRTIGNTLTEVFTYTVSDTNGATDLAQLTITIQGANDTPIANPDTATAVEAGGLNNGSTGSHPTGNVLGNDSDVDAGDTKTVTAFTNSASVSGTLGTALAGSYGSLTLSSGGSYTYVVDNTKATVQALRTNGNTLTETYTYTMLDDAGATSSTTLTITIRGANDNPVATNDTGTAVEAGGINNGTAGSNATGNVLDNDTDVDGVVYGESKTVSAIRTGTEAGSGTAGAVGGALTGSYGVLTLNANGSYTYVVDNTNAAVQALRTTVNRLTESFTYTVGDNAGATDTAQLTITIQGANDTPLAVDDSAFGWPSIAGAPNSGRNPTGNVLNNDSDVDAGDSKSVSGIRIGTEAAGGGLTAVAPGSSSLGGERIEGTYGWLNIGADGSYLYEVDFAKTSSLAPGDIVVDYFTYELKDTGGLTDRAQLSITIRGKNNPPLALPNLPIAIEAGGIANGTPGVDPAGDVTANDFDFEGDALSVDAIRTGRESTSGTAGTIGSELAGLYGWLTQRADGTFTYRVDNNHPLVQALRTGTHTLRDFFTYTVSDIYGSADQATIAVIIRGANDTPVAHDDGGTAIETGGFANTTPGINAAGNVLDNDSDVDGVVYGETKAVSTFAFSGGTTATAGSALAGVYGTLTLSADGSYTYVVDNANPVVEALRTPADTLVETFTYTVIDAAGASTTATLAITIKGANDNPVAQNDVGLATDQTGLPVTVGNVLPNDGDVDSGDSKVVVAIRAGAEMEFGPSGLLGTSVKGTYGSLVINADGTYTYTVDMTNRDVQQAAGRGRILQDVFTYTVADTAGSTDQAELRITLDIAAPHQDFPASPFFGRDESRLGREVPILNFTPIVYVEKVIGQIDQNISLSDRRNDGARPWLAAWPEVQSTSIGAGLGIDRENFVKQAVGSSRSFSRYDASIVDSRAGRVSLSADGLFPDDSIFTPDKEENLANLAKPAKRSAAPSFSEQLRQSSDRVRPLSAVSRPAAQTNETPSRP